MDNTKGQELYSLCERLFPIMRSITGKGVRQTLEITNNICGDMKIYEVPSGTNVFDWTIPNEWNVNDAYIADINGNKIIDIKNNNLHLMGYSLPQDRIIPTRELLEHIYTLPDQPDLIPYVTSYYKERWGFCMSENQKKLLKDSQYHILIDSTLKKGSLSYGEVFIGEGNKPEIFLSTYICHPQMANNELSGPSVAAHLIKWIKTIKDRKYNYRIVFVPETIGSITYLAKNFSNMHNIIAGFNLTCLGDNNTFSYMPSKYGNTLADKAAINILKNSTKNYKTYSFLERGSDERQYCSAGIDLPVCSIMRSKYGEYPEYHTSADDLSFISPEGLYGSYEIYKKLIEALEYNQYYKCTVACEPQLGKRGLYPTISIKGSADHVRKMTNFIAYADGTNDLFDISEIIKCPVNELIPIIDTLKEADLIC